MDGSFWIRVWFKQESIGLGKYVEENLGFLMNGNLATFFSVHGHFVFLFKFGSSAYF